MRYLAPAKHWLPKKIWMDAMLRQHAWTVSTAATFFEHFQVGRPEFFQTQASEASVVWYS